MNDRYLDLKEAAEYCRCSVKTLRRRIASGLLTPMRNGKKQIFTESKIRMFIEKPSQSSVNPKSTEEVFFGEEEKRMFERDLREMLGIDPNGVSLPADSLLRVQQERESRRKVDLFNQRMDQMKRDDLMLKLRSKI